MTVTTLGYTMVICGNADDPQHRYRGRIEKVKFGVPIQEAFAHDIPATLLVLLLKVNKDGPSKKDIWRAPGNQAQVRKLSHIMQHGRLVNIANFSVYTAASVIKKFLSKLPGGIFGLENEQTLFDLFSQADAEKQRQIFCRVVYSLSVPSQHLLVLLFGTFYMISESSDVYGTKMTPDAIGISVAPSLFHTCIHDGQRAKMEDVMRFKIASEVISKIIESFGYANLFPRECYEFYARITGRTLRVDDNDSRFRFAPPTIFPQSDAEHDVLIFGAPMRLDDGGRYDCGCESGPSSSLRQPTVTYHRLSSSAGEVQVQSDFEEEEHRSLKKDRLGQSLESTHSLTYLEWVHERQTRRMRTRSEW
uniref:Rho-GAP domain-containing protein n=1 Tax=Parascaris univalens TaxID=6257 RepID=A0A915CCE2_PARUN